jgi:hypothetical protein
MTDVFRLALNEIQPSQLYLNRAKLARVDAAWRPRSLDTLPPVPVTCLDGRIVYTDGHHRAFAAYCSGFEELRVFWDEDLQASIDWEAYRICVLWCRDAGIFTIHALAGRVLSMEEYTTCWLDRCARMHAALEDG